jgi:protein ImuB
MAVTAVECRHSPKANEMLWLCILLPQLPLEALHPQESQDLLVVTANENNARWIVCCNDTARRMNISISMSYTTALAMHTNLVALERKPRAEQATIERLAAWAYQFSSRVILSEIAMDMRLARNTCLWIEIGASMKLFGGFRLLLEQIEEEFKTLQYAYSFGIGPTLEGAALLARTGIRLAITSTDALCRKIRDFPVSALALATETTQQLEFVGIRTIGALLDIPREAIAKRFALSTSHFLNRLIGSAADLRVPFILPDTYAAHFEFEFEIRNTEALLFTLRRMLREFSGFLRARDTAVQLFSIRLGHRSDGVTQLDIGMSTPERNPDRFFALAREKLDHMNLPASTISVSIFAEHFAAPTDLQIDALSGSTQQREPLSHTLDRIAARLGEDNVYGIALQPEHRPEFSWSKTGCAQKVARHYFPDRPLWLLPQPRQIQSSVVPASSSFERIEGGWWEGSDIQRDYYIIESADGSALWAFKDLNDSCWYLHGFWS